MRKNGSETTNEEIKNALKNIKNGPVAKPDEVHSELL